MAKKLDKNQKQVEDIQQNEEVLQAPPMESQKVDIREYGYLGTDTALIPCEQIFKLVPLLHDIFKKESQLQYIDGATLEETLKSGQHMITELGMAALLGSKFIEEWHIENIKNGVAFHYTEKEERLKNSIEVKKEVVKK